MQRRASVDEHDGAQVAAEGDELDESARTEARSEL
jgi:hypothetical protein